MSTTSIADELLARPRPPVEHLISDLGCEAFYLVEMASFSRGIIAAGRDERWLSVDDLRRRVSNLNVLLAAYDAATASGAPINWQDWRAMVAERGGRR